MQNFSPIGVDAGLVIRLITSRQDVAVEKRLRD
jgi:hypothetical protein